MWWLRPAAREKMKQNMEVERIWNSRARVLELSRGLLPNLENTMRLNMKMLIASKKVGSFQLGLRLKMLTKLKRKTMVRELEVLRNNDFGSSWERG